MAKKNDKSIIYKNIKLYLEKLEKNRISCKNVYLYGSYAKGNYSEYSDIDLAIISDNFTGDIIDDQLLLMRFRRDIDSRIEPHPFLPNEFTSSDPYVRTIIETGEDLSFLLY